MPRRREKRFVFYVLTATYRIIEHTPRILLFGKTEDGQHLCAEDDTFEPYFYAIPAQGQIEEAQKACEQQANSSQNYHVKRVERVTKQYLNQEREMLRIVVNVPSAVPSISRSVQELGSVSSVHEYDIPFVRRYFIDKGITPLMQVEATGEPTTLKLKISGIRIHSIGQSSDTQVPSLRVLGFDIETYLPADETEVNPEQHPILMVAFSGRDFSRVITWKRFETDLDYVEFVDSEAELIKRCRSVIEQYAPDIITGYYSDGFDFPYLAARARKYRIPLQYGQDYSELSVDRRGETSASITGIPHIDTFKVVRTIFSRTLTSDTLALGDVAQELLGYTKDDVDITSLSEVWDHNQKDLDRFVEYNLKDAHIAAELCEQVLPNLMEMVRLVGQDIHDINRMRFSQMVEWFLLRQAYEFNEVAPNKPGGEEMRERRSASFEGAFVYQPEPGLYEDVVVFDFRSLYPSIIVSHNLSVETLQCSCCESCSEGKEPEELREQGIWVCQRSKGFIATVIGDLITRRVRVKEMLKKHPENMVMKARSDSLKILANSFYGYLSFPAARWYSLDCARATAMLGRFYIKQVIEQAHDRGFRVLYSDTDSVFISLESQTLTEVQAFVDEINEQLPGIMELQYQGYFNRGLFVSMKHQETGAKKKYALMQEDGELEIKGFESVRRNTSALAREVQEEVLRRMLRDNEAQNAIDYFKNVVGQLQEHTIEVEKLVIGTRLSKDPRKYESTGPHVRAALRMREQGQRVGRGTIAYYIVTKGKGSISDRVKLPEEVQDDYDEEYYIQHQLIPAVERIFEVFGVDVKRMLSQNSQSTLEGFF